MKSGKTFLALALLAAVAAPRLAYAQTAGMQDCIQQGYKPGTAGFYHCLQESTASSGGAGIPGTGVDNGPATGDVGSILKGQPQDAVTDYSGSSMEGATSPDPDILKQLNSGAKPGN